MKISLNTIKSLNRQYGCADNIAPGSIDDLVMKIGSQLAAVENVKDFGKKYQGIVLVQIVSCEPHANADKLQVCTIDDGGNTPNVNRGENGYIQVVCGAPNVRPGMTVAWLPPGSIVPESYDKDPLVLEARELRGVVSNGMLASARELGLGDNHEGILEITEEIVPGTLFADTYELSGDHIIELENKMFTHRPDCFGFLGISRELAGIQGMPFVSPDWYVQNPDFPEIEDIDLPLEVINEVPDLVPRFTAITMAEVEVKQSPLWLQIELSKVGLRPINNIVDYTNYFMLLTGQPLHAYDYNKVAELNNNQAKLVVRKPRKGEKIKLLNGKEIEPNEGAILIATDQKSIGIGGVMGGSETEVDAQTKNIIIECASFDMYNIRRTSMAHGLFTDAVTRFNKGQSPLQNLAVLARITDEIRQHANGKVASSVIDNNQLSGDVINRASMHTPVEVTHDFVNNRLGLGLTVDTMALLLVNVEFKVEVTGNTLSITAPFWRTDIEIPEDIVEEIGRLYGYDRIPLKLPERDLTPVMPQPSVTLKSNVRKLLSNAGANELLTYSFVHGNLLDKTGQNLEHAFELSNALSPDLQFYRMSLLPSLLDKVHPNIKAGITSFAIFEIGKAHIKGINDNEQLPLELNRLAFVFAADDKQNRFEGAPYYQAGLYLKTLLDGMHVSNSISPMDYEINELSEQIMAEPFDPERMAVVRIDDRVAGFVGELKSSVRTYLKLPSYVSGFELSLALLEQYAQAGSHYVPLSKFPQVQQDITLKISHAVPYQALYEILSQQLLNHEHTRANLEPLDIYQRDSDSEQKQITFRFIISHYLKTLTSQEVNTMLDHAAERAHEVFGAERV